MLVYVRRGTTFVTVKFRVGWSGQFVVYANGTRVDTLVTAPQWGFRLVAPE